MKSIDLSLYLVLDPEKCGGHDGALAVTRAALAGGITALQLRAPSWHKRALCALALDLKILLTPYAVPLIINDHLDVALAIDADGVHVGQRDLAPSVVRRWIGEDKLLGFSTPNRALLRAARTEPVDYLGIGPVFATTSKLDAAPALGLDGLMALAHAAHLPCVAIGGITRYLAADVRACGVDGVAVVSAICQANAPEAAAVALRAAVALGALHA